MKITSVKTAASTGHCMHLWVRIETDAGVTGLGECVHGGHQAIAIIKELEERFAGTYSPSPGTVYPTLSLLEDLGYATARLEEGNRKVYEITDEGRKYLEENRQTVDDIFGRVDELAGLFFGPAMGTVGRAMAHLGRVTFRAAIRRQGDEQWMRRVQEILERTAREIDEQH